MNILYLEGSTPPYLSRALAFLRRQREPWQVVLPTMSERPLFPKGVEVRLYSDAVPDGTKRTWTTIGRLMELIRQDICRIYVDPAMQDAVDKSLRYLLLPLTPAYTFEGSGSKIGRLVIVSRWPEIHRVLRTRGAGSRPEVISVHPKVPTFVRVAWTLLDALAHAQKCLIHAARKPKDTPAAAKIVLLGQYATPITEMRDMFSSFNPQEVLFFVVSLRERLSASAKIFLRKRLDESDACGWNHWIYRDRDWMRALRTVLRILCFGFTYFFRSDRSGLSPLVLRVGIHVERASWQIRDLLKTIRPKILVTQEERSPEGFLTASLTKQYACKTLNIFDGFVFPSEPFLKPPVFDAWALWGAFQRDMYSKLGVPSDRIFLTGHLKSAKWTFHRKRRLSRYNARYPRLVYFSETPGKFLSDFRLCISQLLREVLTRIPAAHLLVKPHPVEDGDFHREFWEAFPQASVLRLDSDPYDLMETATIVVAATSTTLVESLALGVPIAVYDPTRIMYEIVKEECLLDLTIPQAGEKLAALCERLTADPDSYRPDESFAEYHLGALDGATQSRLAKVIERLSS